MYVFVTWGRIFKTITKVKLDDAMKEEGGGWDHDAGSAV